MLFTAVRTPFPINLELSISRNFNSCTTSSSFVLRSICFPCFIGEAKVLPACLTGFITTPNEVEIEDSNKEINQESKIKKKNKKKLKTQRASINILGLDKITAKTTEISIKLGETKKFGLLQIKAIKCGKINSKNEPGVAAYIQVKDLSDNQNEKVFVFNGWTFSSSPSLRPIDHPIYDLWLVSCENV